MGGQRAVGKPGRRKEPTAAISLHDEGIGAIEGVRPHGVDRSLVVRGLSNREVRHVIANPLSFVSIPPHILLALRPRSAIRLRRSAVVEQAAVCRPHPAPLRSNLILLRTRNLAGGLINTILKHASVDPAATRGAAIIFHLHEGRQKLALLRALKVIAVDFLEDVLRIRLAFLGFHVIPGDLLQRQITGISGIAQTLLNLLAQLVEEPQVTLGVTWRRCRLETPLQHSLGLGEGTGLFHVGCRRHQENLGTDIFGLELAVFNLRRILPERGSLNLLEIAHNQPFKRCQATALHAAIRLRHCRILAEDKIAFHLLIQHCHERFIGRMRTRNTRHEVITPPVFLGRCIAPVGLHQRDRIVLSDLPEAFLRLIADAIYILRPALLVDAWHRQIPRQGVEQGRNISRTLNRRVSTQRHNARAWSAHITGQQLQNCRGTNELRTQSVLSKAQSISKARGAIRRGILCNRLRKVVEVLLRNTAGLLHYLRRIACVMALENLENRIGMLQRFIAFHIPRRTLGLLHVLPRIRDVFSGLWVIAREQTISILGVLVVLRDNHRRIGIRHHIVMEVQLIFQQIINHCTQ